MRSENLTIMLTDIAGYTARTAQQSREENEALLKTHDNLLEPLVRAYKGRLIKKIGDALLIVFRSPTDAIHCGMSMQDALWAYNHTAPADQRLQVRVALHLGDVRLQKGDVFGDPVNITARIEQLTPPDEVYFSASVYMTMNKTEVPCEPVGSFQLQGIPEQVLIYRATPVARGTDDRRENAPPFAMPFLKRLPRSSIRKIVRQTERGPGKEHRRLSRKKGGGN